MSTRETALGLVATALDAITGVTTVVRASRFDLREYSQSQLPLFWLKNPDPRFALQPGMQLHDRCEFFGTLYYIDWNSSATTLNGWIEAVVEGLDYNPTAKALLDWQDTPQTLLETVYPIVGIQFNWILNTYTAQSAF